MFYLTYNGVFDLWLATVTVIVPGESCSPSATTQSATVYINIHSAAIASAREEEERVALLFARFNTFIQQKGALVHECLQSSEFAFFYFQGA